MRQHTVMYIAAKTADGHAEGEPTLAQNNAELVHDLYDAFRTGYMPTVERLLADDFTWHAPGRGQNAGIRRGKAELRTPCREA